MIEGEGRRRGTDPADPPSGLPVPRSARDLTAAWLTAALQAGSRVVTPPVISVRHEPVGAGRSFAGEVFRVFLTYAREDASAPPTLIAKLASFHPRTRSLLIEFGNYGREVVFYTELGERAGVPVPGCYYAASDATSGHFVLLLEDLRSAIPGNQIEGATRAQSETVVRAIAAFHARWWEDASLAERPWMRVETDAERVKQLYREGLHAFRERDAGKRHPLLLETAEWIGRALPYVKIRLEPPARGFTLVHGDLRLDNVLFPSPEGGRFVLLDWQGPVAGRGSMDLAYWLALSLTRNVRRACEQEMLALYHRTLRAHGVRRYPRWLLKLEYRFWMLIFVGGVVSGLGQLDAFADQGEALEETLLLRLEAALQDAKLDRLLALFGLWYRLRAWVDRKRGGTR